VADRAFGTVNAIRSDQLIRQHCACSHGSVSRAHASHRDAATNLRAVLTNVLIALLLRSALGPQPCFGLYLRARVASPALRKRDHRFVVIDRAMLINPAAAMHIRNVDSSKTRLCSHRLLFLIADIVGFHSRGDSDDPFVGS
jgi:hypothetical protein